MAKGYKTGGKDFKPGNCANPRGRIPLTPEQKKFREITQASVIEIAKKYINSPKEVLRAAADDPFTPVLELMLIAWIKQGISGDHKATEAYLQRVIGKVPDKVEIGGVLAQYKAPDGETTNFSIEEKE